MVPAMAKSAPGSTILKKNQMIRENRPGSTVLYKSDDLGKQAWVYSIIQIRLSGKTGLGLQFYTNQMIRENRPGSTILYKNQMIRENRPGSTVLYKSDDQGNQAWVYSIIQIR